MSYRIYWFDLSDLIVQARFLSLSAFMRKETYWELSYAPTTTCNKVSQAAVMYTVRRENTWLESELLRYSSSTGHWNLSNKPRDFWFPSELQQNAREDTSVLQGKISFWSGNCSGDVFHSLTQQHPTCLYSGYTGIHCQPPLSSLLTGVYPVAWERYVYHYYNQ